MLKERLFIYGEIYQISIPLAIGILVFFILLFTYGYFWIRRHNRKENEKRNLNKDIHQLGKK
ncbi:MAG: hypothetical protein JWO92_1392 [Chitinophagaceae bacterium]|nr:hypothetical protein [Chitinophagaceae bacterium]